MSGFCGYIGGEPSGADIAAAMLDKISHRGTHCALYSSGEPVLAGLGRRSFDEQDQDSLPSIGDGSLILAFSGRIFNVDALRNELSARGHVFETQSQEECVLRLYQEYGADCLTKLGGMFAFVIYDTVNCRLFGARDSFGVKPFYYSQVNGAFVFGSEIKSLLAFPGFAPELNEEALAQYLTFQYSVLPETFFKGVFKLPAAHYLIYENGHAVFTRYFSPAFGAADISPDIAADNIDSALREAVRTHASDASGNKSEVGALLSGGVDSSYIAACLSRFRENDKTHCFTVEFENEAYSETAHAKALADHLGLVHHVRTIKTTEYWESLPLTQYHMDEPLADPASVALFFACKEAACHVPVAFTGEGSDEFFGGYNIYREPLDLKPITSLPLPLRKILGKLASILPFDIKGKNYFIRGAKTVEERFFGNAMIFSYKERLSLLKNNAGAPPSDITAPVYKRAKNADDITKMQLVDIYLWLVDDILLQSDKMSMAHGLELRAPLMDMEIVKIALRLPTELRVNKKSTKYAFRKAASRHLPKESSSRKKLGFPVPIRVWLREEKYYTHVKEYFESETAKRYFHTDRLIKLLDAHRSGKKDNSRKIWTIYIFLVWYEVFFKID